MIHHPPRSTLFPYPTPFLSLPCQEGRLADRREREEPRRLAHGAAAAAPYLEHLPRQVRGSQPRAGGQARSRLGAVRVDRSEEQTSELQSPLNLVCRLLLGRH